MGTYRTSAPFTTVERLEARELARIDMEKAWNDMLERLRLEGGVELVENMLKKAAENIRLWRKER